MYFGRALWNRGWTVVLLARLRWLLAAEYAGDRKAKMVNHVVQKTLEL